MQTPNANNGQFSLSEASLFFIIVYTRWNSLSRWIFKRFRKLRVELKTAIIFESVLVLVPVLKVVSISGLFLVLKIFIIGDPVSYTHLTLPTIYSV